MDSKTPKHWHKAPPGECDYCDRLREKGENMHPPHTPSPCCESGKRPHCSCDICF